jgi:hypothetical protein
MGYDIGDYARPRVIKIEVWAQISDTMNLGQLDTQLCIHK